MRICIVAFAKTVKYITHMLRKDQEIKWTPKEKQSIKNIKKAIAKAPVLEILNFSKYFLIFSFFLEHTVVGVLLQKNHEGHEKPIDFYSKTLIDSPLKYNILDKHDYTPV